MKIFTFLTVTETNNLAFILYKKFSRQTSLYQAQNFVVAAIKVADVISQFSLLTLLKYLCQQYHKRKLSRKFLLFNSLIPNDVLNVFSDWSIKICYVYVSCAY